MVLGTGKKMKILFVTENMPLPAIAGSSQRTAILLRSIASFAKVDLFLLKGEKEKDFLKQSGYGVVGSFDVKKQENLFSNIYRVLFPLYDYQAKKSISDNIKKTFEDGEYDLLIGRYVRPSLIAGLSKIGPSVIDVDDIDLSALKNRINSQHTSFLVKCILKHRLRILEKNFFKLLKPYKCLFLASDQDISLVEHDNKYVIPNISFNAPTNATYTPSVSNTILWVGSFNHRVNLEGLDAFITNDWDKIIAICPAAILRVVGSHLPENMANKWSLINNVEIAGFVENLESEYIKAAFSIVPLWDGAGTKIKVLESFMFSRTSVVTEHAARGFDVFKCNHSIEVADSNEDLINKTIALLNDTTRRHIMEQDGHRLVEEHFSSVSVTQSIKSALESI